MPMATLGVAKTAPKPLAFSPSHRQRLAKNWNGVEQSGTSASGQLQPATLASVTRTLAPKIAKSSWPM